MMNQRRNIHSEYLSDQGKRTLLLDYLASMYGIIDELTHVLLDLDGVSTTKDLHDEECHYICTLAMDLLADWVIVRPMMQDLYNDQLPTPPSMKQ